MAPTDAFSKPFYNSKINGKKYVENLIKSVRQAGEDKEASKAVRQTKGATKLLEIVRKGEKIDRERLEGDFEDVMGLFGEMEDIQIYNDLISGAETSTQEDPKPDATIADEVEALTAQGDELMEQAEKAKTRGKAQQLEKQADEYFKVAEEMLDETPVEQGGRRKTKRAPAKMTVEEAKKLVSEQRQKEIEQEVMREAGKESQPAPRAQAPQARPSASTSSASAPDLSAPAPPAPAPAPAPAPERKRPKESDILDPTPVTSVDLIPNERRSAEFKTAKQLRSDIEFFFESFPDMLEKEMREYIRVNKTSKKELSRFHRKIMGKLQPSESISPEQKKVGVVISADEYIRQAINKALIDAKMMSMSPADVVELSVRGADKKDDTESYGSYEVKKSKSGKLAAQKEPIYRYVPKVDEEQEREPRRTAGLQLRQRETKPQTAKRQVRNNPFLQRHTNNIRLKYLY
jgi:hypothetical protein